MIMVSLLITVGYLLFQKAFRAAPLAKLLPADSTVALIEINTNLEHSQVIRTTELLKDHPEYSKEKFIELIENTLSADYETDIQGWLGRQVGLALFHSASEEGKLNQVYFAEYLNKKAVNDFLIAKHATINEYNEVTTFRLEEGPQFFTLIDGYLVFSSEEQAIYDIIDFSQSSEAKLYSSDKYRRVDNNLPLAKIGYIYIDFDQINDSVF